MKTLADFLQIWCEVQQGVATSYPAADYPHYSAAFKSGDLLGALDVVADRVELDGKRHAILQHYLAGFMCAAAGLPTPILRNKNGRLVSMTAKHKVVQSLNMHPFNYTFEELQQESDNGLALASMVRVTFVTTTSMRLKKLREVFTQWSSLLKGETASITLFRPSVAKNNGLCVLLDEVHNREFDKANSLTDRAAKDAARAEVLAWWACKSSTLETLMQAYTGRHMPQGFYFGTSAAYQKEFREGTSLDNPKRIEFVNTMLEYIV